MEQVFLHGKTRDRIQDLMKSHKVAQAELAARIGCSESIRTHLPLRRCGSDLFAVMTRMELDLRCSDGLALLFYR